MGNTQAVLLETMHHVMRHVINCAFALEAGTVIRGVTVSNPLRHIGGVIAMTEMIPACFTPDVERFIRKLCARRRHERGG